MNTNDGTIIKRSNTFKVTPLEDHFIPMVIDPTEKQMNRKPPRVGKNEPCPCGSGLKFKKCHFTGGKVVVCQE